MLNSLIIILREVLEAAIIISVIMASLEITKIKSSWLLWCALVGIIGSILMAEHFSVISNAFDGVGQEISNATMLFTIALFMIIYLFIFMRYSYSRFNFDSFIRPVLLIIISIAVMREGVEIIIYINGYIAHISDSLPLLIGGSIGAWIGFSTGILIYYSLFHCALNLRIKIIIFVSAILCAGMVSEGVLYLIQADWVESGRPLWDSSSIISESSIVGQLLYAIFAYEATPAPIQVIVYGVTLSVILFLFLITNRLNNNSHDYSNKR